jgi:kexin
MGRADHGLSTADITGALGYNDGTLPDDYTNGSYTDLMDGTSGSTPIAAGVAALVIQANPQLTWRDVRRVLAYSARKNDPTDSDWTTNLAGLHVNHKYGFGVTDANAAVVLAKGFTPGAEEKTTATPLQTPALAIPDNDPAGIGSSLVVTGSEVGHVEFVEITLTVIHPRTGDLEISLDRGSGPVDLLTVPHSCAKDRVTHNEKCSPLKAWIFGSVRHLDEPADGTWTLKIKDKVSGNVGTLQSWGLTFWGRP